MERSTNALEELAEEIQMIVTYIYHGSGECGAAEARKIAKAQRIVAELAKVKIVKVHSLKGKKVVKIDYPEREDANIAFLKCRAIAEEGDRDGK